MRVKVYSTTACPYCRMVKDFLRKNNIKFEDIDVSSNHEAAHEMIEKSGQMGVPVTDIEGEIVVGYNISALKKALKIK